MKCHPLIQELLDAARENPAPPFESQSVAEVRRTRNRVIRNLMGTGPEMTRVEDHLVPVQGGQIGLRLYCPDRPGPLPVLMWFHGGGWVLGDIATHDGPCRKLALMSGFCLASVDYRLAPEHKFPVAVNDCLAATLWVAENAGRLGLAPGRVFLGGDSAGGGLVFAVALLAGERGGPRFAGLVSAYPAVDLTTYDRPSYREYWDKVILSGEAVRYYRRQYLADPRDAADPLASPLLAPDLSGLPPTLLITAEHDVLTSEGEAMARRLQKEGVDTVYKCFPGMIHLFFGMERLGPQDSGLAAAADFLASH